MSKKEKQNKRAAGASLIRSSAAEYLTFVAAGGSSEISVEMRYEDENVWLTQKMMAELYAVSVPAINQHLKRIFADNELEESSAIKQYLITAAELAKTHAESEFEKYRIVQDRHYVSDFDALLKKLESGTADEQ